MSAPLSPAARTRTSTMPAPGVGSGCCSTLSCLSWIVTARIATANLLSDQLGHALDVRSLGEHVDRTDAHEPVPGLDQLGGVGGQRGRVAGYVDDPLGQRLDDP